MACTAEQAPLQPNWPGLGQRGPAWHRLGPRGAAGAQPRQGLTNRQQAVDNNDSTGLAQAAHAQAAAQPGYSPPRPGLQGPQPGPPGLDGHASTTGRARKACRWLWLRRLGTKAEGRVVRRRVAPV